MSATTSDETSESLADIRERIDAIDNAILDLLAERQHCVEAMGAYKPDAQAVIAEPRRQEVLNSRRHWGEARGLDGQFVHGLYRMLTDYFISLQLRTLDRREPAESAPTKPVSTPAENQPLIYSCSGCSSAAQLANHLALRADREGLAEMSCIAGVGGDVPALLKTACSGRPTIAVDGCRLHCAKRSLERHGVKPALSVSLNDWGVKKRLHADFDADEAERVYRGLLTEITRHFSAATA
ncbi:MAG: chorismate mutase [Gammaproteobacteria bacterium]|nr:chorismate mutase [Gammaproteobacteria bacterium]